jgi:hypothetical protein
MENHRKYHSFIILFTIYGNYTPLDLYKLQAVIPGWMPESSLMDVNLG